MYSVYVDIDGCEDCFFSFDDFIEADEKFDQLREQYKRTKKASVFLYDALNGQILDQRTFGRRADE